MLWGRSSPHERQTMLATRLGGLLHVPVFDLGAIAYEAEESYLWWCESLGERADRIVWLDVSWGMAIYRIVHRHIVLSMAGTSPFWTEKAGSVRVANAAVLPERSAAAYR
jgi:hypothetical protein